MSTENTNELRTTDLDGGAVRRERVHENLTREVCNYSNYATFLLAAWIDNSGDRDDQKGINTRVRELAAGCVKLHGLEKENEHDDAPAWFFDFERRLEGFCRSRLELNTGGENVRGSLLSWALSGVNWRELAASVADGWTIEGGK